MFHLLIRNVTNDGISDSNSRRENGVKRMMIEEMEKWGTNWAARKNKLLFAWNACTWYNCATNSEKRTTPLILCHHFKWKITSNSIGMVIYHIESSWRGLDALAFIYHAKSFSSAYSKRYKYTFCVLTGTCQASTSTSLCFRTASASTYTHTENRCRASCYWYTPSTHTI